MTSFQVLSDYLSNVLATELPFARSIWLSAKARFDIIDASLGHIAPGLILKWPNDKAVKFANWVDRGSPSNTRKCALLLKGGGWRHADCLSKTEVICERSLGSLVDPSRPCAAGWRWNPSTRGCYKALTEAADYDLISAESACYDEDLSLVLRKQWEGEKGRKVEARESLAPLAPHVGENQEATLASIASHNENTFVLQLAREANNQMRFVILGGYGDSKKGHKWHWIDGTKFSHYSNWQPGMPQGRREAALLIMNRKGKWMNASANFRFPSTVAVPVCEYSPTS